jgi:predicted tellurium resistance membrane protein TerC
METVIQNLAGNPVLLAVAVVIAILILLSFMKSIVRFLLVAVAVAVLYIAFLSWSGESIQQTIRNAGRAVQGTVKKSADALHWIQGLLKQDDGPRKQPGE